MYVPPKFSLETEQAWSVVRDAGSGTLVRSGDEGLVSVFVPVVVSSDRRRLRSHLAKANPWWRSVEDGEEILALFLSASAYVSPSNYPSRLEGVEHVPTWNYVMAEVRGRVFLRPEAQWLHEQTNEVTAHFESSRDPRWETSESDQEFLQAQYRAIVGLDIEVLSIEGKAKLSQNRLESDRTSVRDNLAQGSLEDRRVAGYMDQWPKS
jgi:transcriptional regulator